MPPNTMIPPNTMCCSPSGKAYFQSNPREAEAQRFIRCPQQRSMCTNNSTPSMQANNSTPSMQPRFSMDISMNHFVRPNLNHFHQFHQQPLRDFPTNVAPPLPNQSRYHFHLPNNPPRLNAPITHFRQPSNPSVGFVPGYFVKPAMKVSTSGGIADHGLRLLSACSDFPSLQETTPLSSASAQSDKQELAAEPTATMPMLCSRAGTESHENHSGESVAQTTTSVANVSPNFSNDDLVIAGQLLHCAAIARASNVTVEILRPELCVEPCSESKFVSVEIQTDQPSLSDRTIVVSEAKDQRAAKKARVEDILVRGDTRKPFGEDITMRLNLFVRVPVTQKPCKCNRSQCLKLYCECFYRGKLCDVALCKCQKCLNTEEHNVPGGARALAVSGVLARRYDAFERQAKKKSGEGCSCKKTQ